MTKPLGQVRLPQYRIFQSPKGYRIIPVDMTAVEMKVAGITEWDWSDPKLVYIEPDEYRAAKSIRKGKRYVAEVWHPRIRRLID